MRDMKPVTEIKEVKTTNNVSYHVRTIETDADDIQWYSPEGHFPTIEEAEAHREKLIDTGYVGVFIVLVITTEIAVR